MAPRDIRQHLPSNLYISDMFNNAPFFLNSQYFSQKVHQKRYYSRPSRKRLVSAPLIRNAQHAISLRFAFRSPSEICVRSYRRFSAPLSRGWIPHEGSRPCMDDENASLMQAWRDIFIIHTAVNSS